MLGKNISHCAEGKSDRIKLHFKIIHCYAIRGKIKLVEMNPRLTLPD